MEETVTKKVGAINFTLISPEQIKRMGVAKVVTPELYDMGGYPVDGGLMDLRLGAIDPGIRCRTCGGKLKECLGHFGYIEMARPTVHVKYVPMIELLLRSSCQECGRICLSPENIEKHKDNILKKAKDAKKCPYCKADQEKVKVDKPTSFISGKKRIFPTEVRARLSRIPDEDLRLLKIDPDSAKPEWGILTLLLVPPVTARPSITLDTGERSEDDLTHKLGDIVRSNQRLWENLNAGAPEVIIEDLWDLLQYHITTFFDNSIASVPPARHRSGQPLETLHERIKGKEGRIRHNLAGKRVNFSGRTVISPDPFIKLNEVGIPLEVAKILTVPERVTTANMAKLKVLMKRIDKWPGASYIIRPDGKHKKITEELKDELVDEIQIGYIVERYLQDGDMVLFNRHPSLHRASLMGHAVRILPGRTFKLHPGTAGPYNADYDGDEMNVHVPQNEEAMAETKVLLNVNNNLISPKNNTNLLGCIADAVTGNYLLSKNEISKDDAAQLIATAGGDLDRIEKMKGKVLDGKAVFSALLPKLDYVGKSRTNEKVDIRGGLLTSGVIDNSTIGKEGGALIKDIDKHAGREEAMKILHSIFTLGIAYLSKHGFTISLADVNMPTIKNAVSNAVKDSWKKTQELIEAYHANKLPVIPGKTREESREMKILHTLNDVRTKLGDLVKKEIPDSNNANMMILSGSAGNILHVTQMACSVGQQDLWAKRIEIGYTGRTLPFFKKGDLSPTSKGFIKSSYGDGLKPHEFFFGAITGRDALMDTALRTPRSGYLYRRLANALQDIRIEYDGTARDARGKIIQYVYGNDLKDVSKLHLKNDKIDAGEAIGIVTAQSFGEPSTQMTLNVFHFAGVSEMQVTLGLPRLIEIFDARKKPSTPQMEIFLEEQYNKDESARLIAERIKEINFTGIATEFSVLFTEGKIEVKLDRPSMRSARITPKSVIDKLKEAKYKVRLKDDETIIISTETDSFKEMYKMKEKLKDFNISGVKGISQVLIVKRDNKFAILTAGTNLEEILKIKGIHKEKTTTNDLHETSNVLGIEAARNVIIKEINKVVSQQGLDIDKRHTLLIADTMTASGEVKGITRIGIISEKSSILARASFETPIKHFVNASIQGSRDDLRSVIENVILNQPVPIGTGLPGLLVKITGSLGKPKKKPKKKK
ncbi:DNA-directed RNA polymerase subunit A' [Nanoarchaeota archaeon]